MAASYLLTNKLTTIPNVIRQHLNCCCSIFIAMCIAVDVFRFFTLGWHPCCNPQSFPVINHCMCNIFHMRNSTNRQTKLMETLCRWIGIDVFNCIVIQRVTDDFNRHQPWRQADWIFSFLRSLSFFSASQTLKRWVISNQFGLKVSRELKFHGRFGVEFVV